VVLRDMKSGEESQVDIEIITDDPGSVLNLEKP
jgi:TusA-related sulfurtransferase